MQTSDFNSFLVWAENNFNNETIKKELSDLINLVKQYRQGVSIAGKRHPTAESKLKNIKEFFSKIDLTPLTTAQKEILTSSDMESYFIGEESLVQSLTDDFSKLSEPMLTELHRKYIYLCSAIKQTRNGFNNLLEDLHIHEQEIPDNKAVLRLRFKDQAEISNVVNLNEWSKSWYSIARGFSMAVKKSPEDFEIINTEKGSVIIDLLLHLETIQLISDAISSLADMSIKLIELKAALEGYKLIKSEFSNSEDSNEKEYTAKIDELEKGLYEKVVVKLLAENKFNNKDCKNELTSAIKELSKFNQKGGEMGCLPSSITKDECEELNKNIHLLNEKKLPELLEHKEDENS